MSDHMNHHQKHQLLEVGMGAAAEALKQASMMHTATGQQVYHTVTHHHAGQAGAKAVQAMIKAAPVVATTVVAATPVVVAVAVAGTVIYGLWQWFDS